MTQSILYQGKFVYFKQIDNDYDFEIALNTIRDNLHNNVKRDEA